jgi:hypothetical protein
MEQDILIHKPNKVVIMLGMNNSRTSIYLMNKIALEIEAERKNIPELFS